MKSLDTTPASWPAPWSSWARAHGVHTVALLTDMSTPLGLAIGNAVEVEESLEVLAGGGPADVVELTLALAREMLACAGLSDVDPAAVLATAGDGLVAGDGQGPGRRPGRAAGPGAGAGRGAGRPRRLRDRPSTRTAMGVAAWRLGAGRARKEDPVERRGRRACCTARPGDQVQAGDVLYELRADDAARIPAALEAATAAVRIGRTAPDAAYRWSSTGSPRPGAVGRRSDCGGAAWPS